jgi:hypothetical protein
VSIVDETKAVTLTDPVVVGWSWLLEADEEASRRVNDISHRVNPTLIALVTRPWKGRFFHVGVRIRSTSTSFRVTPFREILPPPEERLRQDDNSNLER